MRRRATPPVRSVHGIARATPIPGGLGPSEAGGPAGAQRRDFRLGFGARMCGQSVVTGGVSEG